MAKAVSQTSRTALPEAVFLGKMAPVLWLGFLAHLHLRSSGLGLACARLAQKRDENTPEAKQEPGAQPLRLQQPIRSRQPFFHPKKWRWERRQR